jgi:hypothetical protein
VIFVEDMFSRLVPAHSIYLALASALGLAACGGGEGMQTPDDPCTNPGEVAFTGTVNGQPVDERLTGLSTTFENAFGGGTTGTLEVAFSSDGADRLFIEFGTNIQDGESSDARGFIDLSNQGKLSVGNCNIEAFFSTISLNEESDAGLPRGGTFVLRSLRAEPFCTGADVSGTITGCFTFLDP